jgi:hypothetical protein
VLTAAQIVTLACQIAKCPGMTQIAGQRLNEVLIDLAIDQDLELIRRTTTINIQPGTQNYALPTNFLRMKECFYNVEGAVFVLTEYDLSEFDALFTGPNNSAYPELYALDLPSNSIYFYPLPLVPLSVTLRYMDSNVEILTPDTSSIVPWFEKQSYLIDQLAAKMMAMTDDARYSEFKQDSDEDLRRYLKLNNGSTLKTVGLDPRRFNMPGKLKATKLYP